MSTLIVLVAVSDGTEINLERELLSNQGQGTTATAAPTKSAAETLRELKRIEKMRDS